MRALIISAERFEDSEFAEPLHQLRAKGVEVDLAAPQKGLITGKYGHMVHASRSISPPSCRLSSRPSDWHDAMMS
jgi:protease I